MTKRMLLVGFDTDANLNLKGYLSKVLPGWVIQAENEVQLYLEDKVEKYSAAGLDLLYTLEDVFETQIVLFGFTKKINKHLEVNKDQQDRLMNILQDILLEQHGKTEVFVWNNSTCPRLKDIAGVVSREVTKSTPICVYLNQLDEFSNATVVKVLNP